MSDIHDTMKQERDLVRRNVAALDEIVAEIQPLASQPTETQKIAMALHYLHLARLLFKDYGHGSWLDTPEDVT